MFKFRNTVYNLINIRYTKSVKEAESTPFLPNLYTANPIVTKTDFIILESVVHQIYPIVAPKILTIPSELDEWLNGPASWPFCGTVALLVNRIYPESYLAYDSQNNHCFNFVPVLNFAKKHIKILRTENIIQVRSESAEIDLTRDQFTYYQPELIHLDRPSESTFLSNLFQDHTTIEFHQLAHFYTKRHLNIHNSSQRLQKWANSEFKC